MNDIEDISFNVYIMTVNKSVADGYKESFLNEAQNKCDINLKDYEDSNSSLYRISTEVINDKFLWIYAQVGEWKYASDYKKADSGNYKPLPADIENGDYIFINPFFAIYSFEKAKAYLSNGQKKGMLSRYLKDFFNLRDSKKEVKLQELIADHASIEKNFHILKSMRFERLPLPLFEPLQTSNVQSSNERLALYKIIECISNGIAKVVKQKEEFTFEGLELPRNRKRDFIKSLIGIFVKPDSFVNPKSFVLIGKDFDGEKTEIRGDNLTRVILIEVSRNDNERLLNPNEVQTAIITKIEEEENE